jgi:hypothetical protein
MALPGSIEMSPASHRRPKIIGIDPGVAALTVGTRRIRSSAPRGMRPNGLTSRRQIVLRLSTPRRNEIRTAEVTGSRCLARDLAIGLPIEHLPQSTLLALRRVAIAGPRG